MRTGIHPALIIFHCAGFRRDGPAEIFMFYRYTTIFRENSALPTKPSILNISVPFAISSFP
jgi:hypothetical protein